MPTVDKTAALEMRIVELENRLKALQPALTSISADELVAYFHKPWRCINECSCGPCNCDRFSMAASLVNVARFAQVAGVLSKESLTHLTEEVTQKLNQQMK